MPPSRLSILYLIGVICVFTVIMQILLFLFSKSFTSFRSIDSRRNFEMNRIHQEEIPSRVTYKDYLDRPSTDLTKLHENWKREATILGKFPYEKKFLTIGIPTIRRIGDEYIMGTIRSIVNNTKAEELNEIYLVIFLADFNETWTADIIKRMNETFSELISAGTLVVIRSWETFYPPLKKLKNTYNHSYAQRKWRSKQNVDYAFLFLYSKLLSNYYIQMEDDIYTLPGYFQAIKDYISKVQSEWTCIEFSELGFIGKLYHSYDLEKLAKMVLLFYEEQPCDFTYLYFNIQMLQFRRIIRRPTIFQHVGLKSSLPGKIQSLKDRFFDNSEKIYNGDNPAAKIYTNMKVQAGESFSPESAYSGEPGYFWSKGNGKTGDWFIIVFDDPQRIEKILILTGSREHSEDTIKHGKLHASLSLVAVEASRPRCTNDIFLGYFDNGNIKVENLTSILGPFKIHCVGITLTENQNWWIIIKEIAVFIAD
ncbi:alpha-1,3-mannosyl-glycoprotein 4-beta-N-acetylglucosaminyltransferase C-like isoform X1 [Crassostrea virginica]|uniref:Alpha-1,3-mannosyl-glycoprotein 4-beta-N-acetylglucosaminyltransferase C-like isoform X1 n=1 Tax=Crassostrea virginica TaxID=6565 RepID=A0A8B8BLK8_CRAVI|nr:alpha-1,3-mannosyl-glycoprotein 4-beta-N-acetylglucosaminyltransferase C-like isoform X1 [Crassostrea virginica]